MAEDFNTQAWGPSQYRIDARNRVNEIRSLEKSNAEEIVRLVRLAFPMEKDRAEILGGLVAGSHRVTAILAELSEGPRKAWATEHRLVVAELSERVLRKDDLRSSRLTAERMSELAERAEALPSHLRKAECLRLETERTYCKVSFESREQHHASAMSELNKVKEAEPIKGSERNTLIQKIFGRLRSPPAQPAPPLTHVKLEPVQIKVDRSLLSLEKDGLGDRDM